MNKIIFRLSLCVFALGASGLPTSQVNADTLEDSFEMKGTPNNENSTLTDESDKIEEVNTIDSTSSEDENITDSTIPVETSESEPINETNPTDDFSLPSLLSDSELMNENSAVSRALPEGATPRATTVKNESELEEALQYGGTIYIAKSFTVSSQISYRASFRLIGQGYTLSFTGTGGFFSGDANSATITVNNLSIKSNVTRISTGATTVFSFEGSGTLNLNDVNYTATKGCPLTSSDNVSTSIAVNLSGTNNLSTSGSGAPDTTLLKNISSIKVSGGKTTIVDTTPNKSGNDPRNDCYSVIKFHTNGAHKLDIASGASLTIESSKDILFDSNNTLAMNVGSNATFDYLSTGGKNQIIAASDYASPSGTFKVTVGEGSKTAFRTEGSAASFKNNMQMAVTASTPEYVTFKSENGRAALSSGSKVSFTNKADNSGISGNYILGETPTGSGSENKKDVGVGSTVNFSKGSYKEVKYYKGQAEEPIELTASAVTEKSVSTIKSSLTGGYKNYSKFELLASPNQLSGSQISSASKKAKNDSSGKSGYYQSGTLATNGLLPDFENVWAGDYYLYVKVTNNSTGKASDWIKCEVNVPEYKLITSYGTVGFVGGYSLKAITTAELVNYGNTERAFTYDKFTATSGSSANVKLVNKQTAGNKELVLNVTAKNNNSAPSWGPLTLGSNSFSGQVDLSPYWTGDGNNNAYFTVNGSYSGPLGKSQIENVNYKLTMSISTIN